jgi:hypothetical protein
MEPALGPLAEVVVSSWNKREPVPEVTEMEPPVVAPLAVNVAFEPLPQHTVVSLL